MPIPQGHSTLATISESAQHTVAGKYSCVFGTAFAQPHALVARTASRPEPPSLTSVDAVSMRRKVLLVDDDPYSTTQLRQAAGVRRACSRRICGRERSGGPRHARRNADYSVLITDLRMPGMGGMDLIRELAHASGDGHHDRHDGLWFCSTAWSRRCGSGLCDFLTKPIDPTNLGDRHRPRPPQEAGVARTRSRSSASSSRRITAFHNIISKNPEMHKIFQLIPPHRRHQEHGPDRGGDRHG